MYVTLRHASAGPFRRAKGGEDGSLIIHQDSYVKLALLVLNKFGRAAVL